MAGYKGYRRAEGKRHQGPSLAHRCRGGARAVHARHFSVFPRAGSGCLPCQAELARRQELGRRRETPPPSSALDNRVPVRPNCHARIPARNDAQDESGGEDPGPSRETEE